MMANTEKITAQDCFDLIKAATQARGVARIAYMDAARQAIKSLGVRDIKRLIKQTDQLDREHLNVLLGIGIKGNLYNAVLRHYMKYQGVM